jgi:hypothetical protein
VARRRGSGHGGGRAHASSYTDGVVIICQRVVEVTEEEFAAQKQANAETKDRAKRAKRVAAVRAEPIEVKKAVFGRTKYIWRGVEFDIEEEALRRREEKAAAEENGGGSR